MPNSPRWLDNLLQDTRYALRGLRRAPGFAAAVVLTLALGIGANAVMFGVVDRLMFRPAPFLHEPASVDRVYLRLSLRDRELTQTVFPYTRYQDIRRATTSFSQYAAFARDELGVGAGEATRTRTVLAVSREFFGFFDAQPALGRFFNPAEDTIPAGTNVAVIDHAYWQSDLGGRDVLGTQLQVGNAQYTVVGVAPEGFAGVDENDPPAVYIPMTAYGQNQGGNKINNFWLEYTWDWAEMLVRRRPGVSRATASADLSNAFVASRVAARIVHPRYDQTERLNPRAIAGPLKVAAGPDGGLEARTLLWVTGVAGIVLLIACANVANLLLARALKRRREIALRLALGVSRARLAAQSLTECALLAMIGCLAGLALADVGGGAMRRLFLTNVSAIDVATDWRTLGVSAAAAMLAAMATAAAPILHAGKDNLALTLKSGSREGTQQRSLLRSSLLVLQGTLSVVLLVGAGLFVKSLGHVRDLNLGYDADRLVMMQLERRGTPLDSAARVTLRRRMYELAQTLPGVEAVSWTASPPFGRGTNTMALDVPGVDSVMRLGRFTAQLAGDDYFAVASTRIVRGRGFTNADVPGGPRSIVVSDAMARVIWPGRDAIGQCIHISANPLSGARVDTMPCFTVVGIAENVVFNPAADYPFRYYLPTVHLDWADVSLLLRMREGSSAQVEGVRRALQALAPGQSHLTVMSARDMMDGKRRSWLLGATMFVGFGLLALVVAAVGLYGVLAFNVAQRMHEIGVRVALGAQNSDLLGMIVGQGVRLALAGVAAGAGIALVAARWIQPLLYRQSATDPVVIAAVGAVLLLVAVAASAVPAIRAMRADPNTVLRSD